MGINVEAHVDLINMEYKEVTPQDIIDAAERNGFKWYRGGWWNSYNNITAACILGQIAVNLEVNHSSLWTYLNSMEVEGGKVGKWPLDRVSSITDLNDQRGLGVKTYKQLVGILKKALKPHMNKKPMPMQVVKYAAKRKGEK